MIGHLITPHGVVDNAEVCGKLAELLTAAVREGYSESLTLTGLTVGFCRHCGKMHICVEVSEENDMDDLIEALRELVDRIFLEAQIAVTADWSTPIGWGYRDYRKEDPSGNPLPLDQVAAPTVVESRPISVMVH